MHGANHSLSMIHDRDCFQNLPPLSSEIKVAQAEPTKKQSNGKFPHKGVNSHKREASNATVRSSTRPQEKSTDARELTVGFGADGLADLHSSDANLAIICAFL